jgi:3-oxoacyl-[acyl-carrier-protein] synthase II
MKRIAITGIGVVSCHGSGVDAFWDSLLEGKTKIEQITGFDTSMLRSHKAAEVRSIDPLSLPRQKGSSSAPRSVQLGLAAAYLALQHAGVDPAGIDPARAGVVYGAGCALRILSEFHTRVLEEGPRSADPGLFPNTAMSAAACHVSIMLGFRAFNATLSNGETAGLDAIAYAASMLRAGRGDMALAGGLYELSAGDYVGFSLQEMLSTAGDGGDEVSRPFDVRRNGMVLGEGSAVLLLEELDSAVRKGRTIIAEVAGYASQFDPLSKPGYDPLGRGAKAAMRLALRSSGRSPEQVDVVFANANGSRAADLMESRALSTVFSGPRMPKITAIKSSLADTYTAAGAFQVAAAALAIQRSSIPPTLHFGQRGTASKIEPVTSTLTDATVGTALANAFGGHGNNASLVLTAA